MDKATAAAVKLFGLRMCFSLNKNYLLKLEFSIISGSVTYIFPFLPNPIIA